MIYIYDAHLGLLPQTSLGGLHLWIILVFSISISTCSSEALALGWPWSLSLSLSLPLLLCLHVQFPRDMCTNSVFWLVWLVCGPCLHVQSLEGVCTSGLGVPTYEGVLGEESIGDDERLSGEYDLLRSFGDS